MRPDSPCKPPGAVVVCLPSPPSSPSPSLSSQSTPGPSALLLRPLLGPLAVPLARASFGLFPGLVLLCPLLVLSSGELSEKRLDHQAAEGPPFPQALGALPNMPRSWSPGVISSVSPAHREGIPVGGSQRHPTPMVHLARLMFAADEFGIWNMPFVKLFSFKIFHSPENLIRPFIPLNVLAALCIL